MMVNGSCLCGAVKLSVENCDRAIACHCGQCRKQSGHYWASGRAAMADVIINGPVKWYRASDFAQRGFCPTCGSFLFWKHDQEDMINFSLGLIDGPTGLHLQQHIFTANKGDYYNISDNVPQKED